MTNYNERLDEILRTLFEDGTNAYFRHGGLGSFSDYENKKNNDVAEAKAKLQRLMVEARIGTLNKLKNTRPNAETDDATADYLRGYREMEAKVGFELNRLRKQRKSL